MMASLKAVKPRGHALRRYTLRRSRVSSTASSTAVSQSKAAAPSSSAAAAASPSSSAIRVRFAPSPTGNLHVGGARTALFNWLYARNNGGTFVVRIEDTDTARSTRESEQAMIRDLRWLGLDWDEGPQDGDEDNEVGVLGEKGPYRQSERTTIYQELAQQLIDEGHAYRCFCTDEELEAMKAEAEEKKLPPIYRGPWANATEEEVQAKLDAGETYAVRFRVPKDDRVEIDDIVRGRVGWDTNTLGDFVILRSNGLPVYNFCVAVDDAKMEISHVIRAEEHLPNTLRQALVYRALGFPMPTFAHCSLILAPDRSKLSKRHGATSVGQFKELGYLPEAMNNYLAMLGWNDGTEKEIYTVEELSEAFGLDRITKSPAIFDLDKLKWMNGQHLRALDDSALADVLGPVLSSKGLASSGSDEHVVVALPLLREKLELAEDATDEMSAMLGYSFEDTIADASDKNCQKELESGGLKKVADAMLARHADGSLGAAISEGNLKGLLKDVGKELELKGKGLFMPTRIVLTGRSSGPDVGEQLRVVSLAEGAVDVCVGLDARMERLKAWADSA
ncbi:glutamyl-tRNA synthetase [Pycnococcus provasolii]